MTKALTRLSCVLAASVAFAGCSTTGGQRPQAAAYNAAQTRALAEVSAFCDPAPARCTDAQRSALVDLLRDGYLRPPALSPQEASLRRAALHENIRQIMRTPTPARAPLRHTF